MIATQLSLRHFRTYEDLVLPLAPGLCTFVGGNAQGKTNLIEAVYLCCVGRSHRTSSDSDMVSHGAGQAMVEMQIAAGNLNHIVRMDLPASGRKKVSIDGAPVRRLGELFGVATCVLFSPDQMSLVKDGPEVRRRFLDVALCQAQPVYFHHLTQYNRALQQRNALLRDQPNCLDATLEAWDEKLAQSGAAIVARRAAFVAQLDGLAADLHGGIAEGERLQVRYRPHTEAADAESMQAAIRRRHQVDRARGTSTVGPHRDELEVTLAGHLARAFCSQGQQRTAALSLILAQLCAMQQLTGEWPILLLDDVLSELDDARRTALLGLLPQVQTLVTGTNIPDLPDSRWQVTTGKVMVIS